ncbi:MAG: 3-methyl-2-oxobutanoate hydroxymethyltransferase, partial [Gammaproteobacteria bacterium]
MAKITLTSLTKMKKEGRKIACLTAYDASFARIIDEAEMDVTLVGDSLGMVIQGDESTLKVSMRDMIYHTRIVSGVCKHSFIVSDMPFMS